jgi:hypothetical protein
MEVGSALQSARSRPLRTSGTRVRLKINSVQEEESRARCVIGNKSNFGETRGILPCHVRLYGRYWGQSGHDVLHCTCPLMTQSGHGSDQHVRPTFITPPGFAPVRVERKILKQKQQVVAQQLQDTKSYRRVVQNEIKTS